MWDKFIEFFAKRHMLANLMFLGIMVAGMYFWFTTNKEELPNITRDRVSISASYPGASAEQVEYFVTKEIEDKLRGIDGIYQVTSNSGAGSSSVSVELELKRPDRDEIVNEIKAAVYDAKLPDEVTDDPNVREYKSSKKAIIDIGVFNKNENLLTKEKRVELHTYVLALENQLLNLVYISEVRRGAYRQPEIRIEADPVKLKKFHVPLNMIANEIRAQNSRQPAGDLEDLLESKVTLDSELDTVQELENVIIRSGFDSQKVRVKDIGQVTENFKKTKLIQKVNGREGVFLNAVKTADSDILESVDAVKALVKKFNENTLKGTEYEIALLDDESRELRNRLNIILYNGTIGLGLVLVVLLVFLNFHTAFWVAMGIPFTFAFTVVGINMFGYTINNITLGAIIIVMGMIVDDAIIVAENISRYRSEGMGFEEAAIKGTSYVLLPITAAIITTGLSFTPLYMNLGGWHGVMISFLPPVIFLMLGASLFESVLILPGHMSIRMPAWLMGGARKPVKKNTLPPKSVQRSVSKGKVVSEKRVRHWFLVWETAYGNILEKLLKVKYWVFLLAAILLAGSFWSAATFMKFTMFPRTESDQINLMGEAPRGMVAKQTAVLVRPVEEMLSRYIGKEMIGFRTEIARSRRGRAVEENKFRIRIQIVPRGERKKSLNQLIKEWEKVLEPRRREFKKLKFSRGWWGGSESPIQILIKDNNDKNRAAFAGSLAQKMKMHPELDNVEIDKPITNPEYKIEINREEMKRLGISASDIKSTLRASVEGLLLYELKGENEELYVRLTIPEASKKRIEDVLDVPVENRSDYLVPLKNIVVVRREETPASIERQDYIRTLVVYGDMKPGSKKTPLEIAREFEETVFPDLQNKFPTTAVSFIGEIFDSRKTQQDMLKAVMIALALIYAVLALLFSSPYKPFMIMITIPFGVVGVVWCLIGHGMSVYGFFSLIGALGMMGVVINDSIVMLTKLDREYDKCGHKEMSGIQIAAIAKTRLQAVLLTTLTTIAALFPTAYGWAGYDSMLSEMMLVMGWGLIFGTVITLVLIPCLYGFSRDVKHWLQSVFPKNQQAC
ncbi:efflux RND transporter permease subunit [bacterium]|nr:efflux RND transporter permease subunit [bacterium]